MKRLHLPLTEVDLKLKRNPAALGLFSLTLEGAKHPEEVAPQHWPIVVLPAVYITWKQNTVFLKANVKSI